ncbi:MAG TPA: hypothetical protein DCY06_12535, partial [Bacteroidetes bacterium]|nr:hypothetical protein [Bacteroidota bacterium]
DNGILVKEGNEQDLSDKMEYIISSDEVVFKFKANAFETAVSNCSVGNMIKGFEDAVNFANLKKRS